MRPKALVPLLVLLSAPLWGQEETPTQTPREALEATVQLYAEGQVFTPTDLEALDVLKERLVSSGDEDLVGDLELLRWGALTDIRAREARVAAEATLAEDFDAWVQRERMSQNQSFWRGVRNVGLVTFTASTAASLLLAATIDRNDAITRYGFFSDGDDRRRFVDATHWALIGSASTAFLSLFPLLWGEARQ